MSRSSTTAIERQSQEVVRAIVKSVHDRTIVLLLPGTEYELHLRAGAGCEGLQARIGKRVSGTIEAHALRMFVAQGGGRFIEPIQGEPRIIAGRVIAVDQTNRRVLVDVAAPIWMTLEEKQVADAFAVGDLVNCYLQSGATFKTA